MSTDSDEQPFLEEASEQFAWIKGNLGVFDVDTGEGSIPARGLYTRNITWYRGEGYIVTSWRPEHRADCWERIIDWFEKHLN